MTMETMERITKLAMLSPQQIREMDDDHKLKTYVEGLVDIEMALREICSCIIHLWIANPKKESYLRSKVFMKIMDAKILLEGA